MSQLYKQEELEKIQTAKMSSLRQPRAGIGDNASRVGGLDHESTIQEAVFGNSSKNSLESNMRQTFSCFI